MPKTDTDRIDELEKRVRKLERKLEAVIHSTDTEADVDAAEAAHRDRKKASGDENRKKLSDLSRRSGR